MAIRHRFTSGRPDNDDAGAMQPSHWNDDHAIDGLLGALQSLGIAPSVVPYLNSGGAGATFSISAFMVGLMNIASGLSLLQSIGAAPLNSPQLTGVPTAPTPANADSTTKVATTAFVQSAVAAALARGTPLASSQDLNTVVTPGFYYTVDTATVHAPASGDYFMVHVEDMLPSFPGDNLQRAFGLFTADEYVRTRAGGVWGAWRKVLYSDASSSGRAELTGNVSLGSAGTWTDVLSAGVLGAGLFHVVAKVTLKDTAGSSAMLARLTDGTTIFDAGIAYNTAAGTRVIITLVANVLNPAAALKIQAQDASTANGSAVWNETGQTHDTTITWFKIG